MNNNLFKKIEHPRYITGFDGIRAIAIISVISYHLFPNIVSGGYLGVPIFFAVSGYLITDLLLQEFKKTNTIDYKSFFIRRMKRLYPALIVMLLLASAYITLFQKNLLNQLVYVLLSNLFYLNNWWQIFNGSSYFYQFSSPSPFTHLWSLSVEAQYYLIWPFLFMLMQKYSKKMRTIAGVIFLGVVVSSILMALLYTPSTDPSRVYYGTDTRIFSLLLGSALAFVWPSYRLKKSIPAYAKKLLNAVGIVSLVVLGLSFLFLSDQLSFVYYGGMFIVSLFATLLVAVTAHPGADVNNWLTNPLFNWIGKRSYGIYLYQFPVIVFYKEKIPTATSYSPLHLLIGLSILLTISELSYRFVEQPLRKFSYKDSWIFIKTMIKRPFLTRDKLLFLCACTLLGISLYGTILSQLLTGTTDQQQLKQVIKKNKKIADKQKNNTDRNTTNDKLKEFDQTLLDTEYNLTQEEITKAKSIEITAFGDSIILNAFEDLQNIFPKMIVDGDIGRQLYTSIPLITKLDEEELLKHTVLVALGTNGSFTSNQFDDFMSSIGPNRMVYWVNVRVPTKEWQNDVNVMLENKKKKYSNLTVIDWYSYSNKHDDWFYEDRVHPNIDGQAKFSSFIAKKILETD